MGGCYDNNHYDSIFLTQSLTFPPCILHCALASDCVCYFVVQLQVQYEQT